MSQLILRAGPALVFEHDGERRDVTQQALSWLFEPLDVAQDVRLRDLFALLEANPVLLEVFRRDYAFELWQEASKAGAGQACGSEADAKPGIEYLEVYRTLYFDSSSRTYEGGSPRWEFHGIGPVLQADDPQTMARAGTRVQWSVSLSPVGTLLDLPLRVKLEANVCENDLESSRYGRTLHTVTLTPPTLGELLHAVLWELSFHGAPLEREAVNKHLTDISRRLDGDELETDTTPFCFVDEHDLVVLDKLFRRWPAHSAEDLWHAVRCLDDEAPAAQALQLEFGDDVELRGEYAGRSAYELRCAWRDLRRSLLREGNPEGEDS